MCSTSRTSISPIRITTSHRSICCNQYLLKSNNSNKSYVQQSSTIHTEPSLYRCCGVMFTELSNPTGMPRFRVCTALYSVQKLSRMHLGIVADWGAWSRSLYSALYEPITGHVSFDAFIKKYAAVHTGMQSLV